MPLIRNVSGEDRFVPYLGGRLVVDEQTIDVPADGPDGVFAYTQQDGTWAPADAAAERVHADTLDQVAAYVASLNPAAAVVEESTAADLVTAIEGMDPAEVAAVVDAEQARPKPRKTVLKAADDRLAEFDIETPGTEPDADTQPQEG